LKSIISKTTRDLEKTEVIFEIPTKKLLRFVCHQTGGFLT